MAAVPAAVGTPCRFQHGFPPLSLLALALINHIALTYVEFIFCLPRSVRGSGGPDPLHVGQLVVPARPPRGVTQVDCDLGLLAAE